mgnify:FL=1
MEDKRLPAFNFPGLTAYAVGSLAAYSSPWIAPIVGVLVAALAFSVLILVGQAVRERRLQTFGAA